ncbi:MAG: PTS sugar transporter subunit IIA, partial [Atopobium sp.]|nr:PTS sugar transporter subunit IIA [Atopobium sp.]
MATTDAELLKPELVFFDIEAKDAFELFDQLETRLSNLGYIKDTWKEAIS